MSVSNLYDNYWKRKKLLQNTPVFTLKSWQNTDSLCDIELLFFNAIQSKKSILDVGAGDLRLMNKITKAGFTGEYHTQDIGKEFKYTYSDLQQVQRTYEAIICCDVIEHLKLEEGLNLLQRLMDLLTPNGVLILQTPNGRCIRHPSGWDMTHVQCYNLPDLWSLFAVGGHDVQGYRVVFEGLGGILNSAYKRIGRWVITRCLGLDYADNIALIVTKKA